MEKAMALAQQQHQQQMQKQLLLQHQQNHHQQQFLLLQQIQQQQAISRFPSNIDAHLRSPLHPLKNQQQSLNPNPNHLQNPNASILQPNRPQGLPHTSPAHHSELQMAYEDAWRVCHPDFKRPFSSLEDACERLLPYHVVADYEAEEDDRILDSDTTGQALSRSQQWDHNIANKISEFTATFEKQVLAFNIITRKRAVGEFRSEERLLVEQTLLQEERRALFEARAEMEKRGREAQAASRHMAAIAQAEQARAEMMARAPIRASALGAHEMDQEVGHDEMMNGWGDNLQRDEREPSEDFLNDEERENGDIGMQSDWRGGGEFDLNIR